MVVVSRKPCPCRKREGGRERQREKKREIEREMYRKR